MTNYRPLPEDPGPERPFSCAGCLLAGDGGRSIWGEGRRGAPILIVLDNPGLREDAAGRPFVCGTRATLRDALAEAGLTGEDVYVTYVLKCRPHRAYDRGAAWAACLPRLVAQVEEGRPRVLVALGNSVLRALTGDPAAEVREARGRILRWRDFPAVVGYHPLAARRRPALYPSLVADLRRAAGLAGFRTT